MTSKISRYGLLIALAFLFSYIENLFPVHLGIPGVKLGLANLVIFVALYSDGWKGALTISIIRIFLVGFTYTNTFSMIYSLAGGTLSFLLMLLCKKTAKFSRVTVSIVGGVAHNIGQIIIAAIVLQNVNLFYYFPVLMIAGIVTGALIGLLGEAILSKVIRVLNNS
ncbi:MAG: Gx transporter family protein [Clostridiales bacterium]|nr:Gx transporter family protein [Clostridiales bacterium]